MNIVIVILSIILGIIGCPQIIGSIFYLRENKRYLTTLIVWILIEFILGFGVYYFFNNYFNYYLWPTIILLVLSLITTRRDK